MKIALWISSLGGSPMQVGLERGLRQLGHFVEYYRHGHGYDLVIILNHVAHVTNYVYPPFPPHNVPIAFVDCGEYGWGKRGADVVGNYANAFAPGSMAHDTKNPVEQAKLRGFLEGRSFPYLLREHSRFLSYPDNYHCIDYATYYHSECHEVPDRDEYLRRPLDLFVSWGASHPFRVPISDALRGCPVKKEVHVLEQNGAVRLNQSVYFPKIRSARCSPSHCGYGSGSFRVTEVLVRTLLLQAPLQIRTREPLVDGVTCREYSVESNGLEFVSTNICDVLQSAIADPEASFSIYERGYWHCVTHYSEKAVARYALDVVSKHNWAVPTPLDIDAVPITV